MKKQKAKIIDVESNKSLNIYIQIYIYTYTYMQTCKIIEKSFAGGSVAALL